MADILVIKLSALGDLFFALPAMQAIRRHHAADRLVLLTAARFQALMQESGLFEEVWSDPRPSWWSPLRLAALRRRLRARRFARVYDLQWSERSDLYLRLLGDGAGEKVGATPAADRPFPGRRDPRPIYERHAACLAAVGVETGRPPDLSFLDGDLSHLPVGEPFALLVPGSARHRPLKRWPAEHYGRLARALAARGIQPVVVAGPEEPEAIAEIRAAEPSAWHEPLTYGEIAALGRRARFAVANDTGPGHLLALAGTPTLMLFGGDSDPVKQRPWGEASRTLRCVPLARLPVAQVLEAALGLSR